MDSPHNIQTIVPSLVSNEFPICMMYLFRIVFDNYCIDHRRMMEFVVHKNHLDVQKETKFFHLGGITRLRFFAG